MSFENGYNIEDYIGETIAKYNEDNQIFSKCINILNIYMVRSDWPYNFIECKEVMANIAGQDLEHVTHYFFQFLSQAERGHELLTEWDKNLPKDFKNDCKIFTNLFIPIVNQYYDFINNPLGIDRVIQISKVGYNNLVRIRRIDGESLDLKLSSWDIEKLSKALLDMIKEE